MEPGFNCSELCDGSSSFGSQEQQQRVLQELCTVTVVCMDAVGCTGALGCMDAVGCINAGECSGP